MQQGKLQQDMILGFRYINRKKENSIIVTTDDEMKAGQVNDMLVTHL